jgi:hypothetical protein
MPLLGLMRSDEDDDWRERAHRAGWRDVKILWVLFIAVVVLIAVL